MPQTWPVGLGATGGVGEQPFAAGLFERILLEREGLAADSATAVGAYIRRIDGREIGLTNSRIDSLG